MPCWTDTDEARFGLSVCVSPDLAWRLQVVCDKSDFRHQALFFGGFRQRTSI